MNENALKMSAILKRMKTDCDPLVSQVALDEIESKDKNGPQKKKRLVDEESVELDLLLTDIELSLQHIHQINCSCLIIIGIK